MPCIPGRWGYCGVGWPDDNTETFPDGKNIPFFQNPCTPQAQMRPDLCILVSTCDSYLPVARWTLGLLRARWNPAPPIYLCGASIPESLPLECDSTDWVTIMLRAVRELRAKGYRWAYLILDDQPPQGTCNARHLNETLPGLAEKLDATNIGLLGYRTAGKLEGVDLGPAFHHLEHSSHTYPWKFSLHPALWSLERLEEFLDFQGARLPVEARTPWLFEIFPPNTPKKLLDSTYRVNGADMVAKPLLHLVYKIALFGIKTARECGKSLWGERFVQHFDLQFLGFQHFYSGPYPLFWSGVIHKGGPSLLLKNFFRYSRQERMLEELVEVERLFFEAKAKHKSLQAI